jgi:uncharacterized protein
MVRPQRCRRIGTLPPNSVFKPAGVPARDLDEVVLTVDEFEALRLSDYEGLYQEQAAERMGVSRQTFGRIVEAARKKVAQALVKGMVLRIEGGQVEIAEMRAFECADCGHKWEEPFGTGRPEGCPACQTKNFHRAREEGVSPAGGRGRCQRNRHGGQGGHGRGRRGGRSAGQIQSKETNE